MVFTLGRCMIGCGFLDVFGCGACVGGRVGGEVGFL